jgi:hypothetical protein
LVVSNDSRSTAAVNGGSRGPAAGVVTVFSSRGDVRRSSCAPKSVYSDKLPGTTFPVAESQTYAVRSSTPSHGLLPDGSTPVLNWYCTTVAGSLAETWLVVIASVREVTPLDEVENRTWSNAAISSSVLLASSIRHGERQFGSPVGQPSQAISLSVARTLAPSEVVPGQREKPIT